MSPDSSSGEFAEQVQGEEKRGRDKRREGRRWGRAEVHGGKRRTFKLEIHSSPLPLNVTFPKSLLFSTPNFLICKIA